MIKGKENKHKLGKGLIIGSLLLIIGICIFGYDKAEDIKHKEENKNLIDEFFNSENKEEIKENSKDNQEQYVAVIEIPKINLKTGMVDIKSKNNTVEKHIQILKNSTMPDVENGNFILASHSGTSRISYFRNLNQLSKNDKVHIYYNNIKYTYQVNKVYKIEKNGKLTMYADDKTTLIMTTCDNEDKTKQLVVISYLIGKENI